MIYLMPTMGPSKATRSASSRSSTATFSGELALPKNEAQMHVSTNTHSSIGIHPLLREARLLQFECFEFLPVGLKLDFPGHSFQLAQPTEPQKFPCCLGDRFCVVVEFCGLLERRNF